MTIDNCYSNALNSPALGQLKPGGLALSFGRINHNEFKALWGYDDPSKCLKHPRVFLGACLSGLALDEINILPSPALPKKQPGQYLLALFTQTSGRNFDFHLAHSKPIVPGWHHHHLAQYGHGEELFVVEEAIPHPEHMETQGLWGYELQAFAEIPPGLHAKLGF